MKQGKNKRNNTQNLKEYIQQLAQTGIKELTDIVFPPALFLSYQQLPVSSAQWN